MFILITVRKVRIKTLISLVLIIVIMSLAFGVIFSRQIEPPTQQAQKPLQQPVYLYSLGGAGGSSGALNQPMAVIRHPDGNIYVADMGHRQVKVYFPNGSWAFSFGQGGEGTGKFTYPYGLAVLDNGDLLVGDPANGTIQRFTKRGVFVKEIIKKEQGLKPGLMTRAPQDKILVADLRQHQLVLIDKKGKIIKKIGQQAGLKFPQGLVIVEQENIWPPRDRRPWCCCYRLGYVWNKCCYQILAVPGTVCRYWHRYDIRNTDFCYWPEPLLYHYWGWSLTIEVMTTHGDHDNQYRQSRFRKQA